MTISGTAGGHKPMRPQPQNSKRGTKRTRSHDDDEQAPSKRLQLDQAFRFLDLPGELQNRVYEIAVEDTRKFWPVSYNNKPRKSEKRPLRAELMNGLILAQFNCPFLGLSHTCTKIRSEFRGWWMEGHCIPLCALNRYLSVFLRPPPIKDRERFKTYFNPAGKLRIWVRTDELENMDILRLLKFKVRLPEYNIVFEHAPYVPNDLISGLDQLVSNKNPKWLQWLRASIITQVRLQKGYPMGVHRHTICLVVKEKCAEVWMKHALSMRKETPADFLKTLGLDAIGYWGFRFSVDYT